MKLEESILTSIQAVEPDDGAPPQIVLSFASPKPPHNIHPQDRHIKTVATTLPDPFFGALSTLVIVDPDKWTIPDSYSDLPELCLQPKALESQSTMVEDLKAYMKQGTLHPATAFSLLQTLSLYDLWQTIPHEVHGYIRPPRSPKYLNMEGPTEAEPHLRALMINQENFVDVALQFARGRDLITGTVATNFQKTYAQHMFHKKRKKGFYQKDDTPAMRASV